LSAFFNIESREIDIENISSSHPESDGSFDMANRLGLFREQKLSEMEINFLASLSREERYEAGQTIFREGAAGDRMFIVAEGMVMISKTIPGIGEEALAFLERGDYFGEMALIEDRPRSADARAHPDTGATVLALPREVAGGLLNIEKLSSIRLLKILCWLAAKRVRELHEKLTGWFQLAGGNLDSSLR
jgi:CRP/FNR family cyclic AMP-dependent transcriptional regulator